MKVEIRHEEATDICRKALRQHAIDKGLDPDEKILMSRWYLDMRNKRITFIGESNVTITEESENTEQTEAGGSKTSSGTGTGQGGSQESEGHSQTGSEESGEVSPEEMTYTALQKYVKAQGLNASGTRDVLLEKLRAAV